MHLFIMEKFPRPFITVVMGAGYCCWERIYRGDMVLCTVPPGNLKSQTVRFITELPQRKLDVTNRLGFDLLNKVALLFRHAFRATILIRLAISLIILAIVDSLYFLQLCNCSWRSSFDWFRQAYKFADEDPTVFLKKVLRILKGLSGCLWNRVWDAFLICGFHTCSWK
ncbi:hypothetical protein OROHE_008193 [Orobanche hederae]